MKASDIFGPTFKSVSVGLFYELYKDIQEVFVIKVRPKRNAVHLVLTSIAIILGGLVLPFVWPEYSAFLTQIIALVGITAEGAGRILEVYVGIILCGQATSWITELGSNIVYNVLYGDIKHYLSNKRALELSAEFRDKPERIKSLYDELLQKLRGPDSSMGNRNEDLEDLLELFAFGNPKDVHPLYIQQQRISKIARWKNGNTSDLLNQEKIDNLAGIYEVTPESLKAVLVECINGLHSVSTVPGAKPDDYAEYIIKIMKGDNYGLRIFTQQQTLLVKLRTELEEQKRQNESALEHLSRNHARPLLFTRSPSSILKQNLQLDQELSCIPKKATEVRLSSA